MQHPLDRPGARLYRPHQEIAANIAAIDAGLMSRSEAIAERGSDFDEIAEQLAREQARYAELGIAVTSGRKSTPENEGEESANAQNSETAGAGNGKA